ncbi:allophanate hydrolase [Alcanivorax sp. 1008]|uniref:allophanate hydrolase n=1 Tax=Alcanivorax sp. 1008 TaxID=2816853 RepID=UPI001DE01403|nr:allophanate hydrolase [Alcanivorax sp. 1008]MCC1495644.1 allophanate hydrolase [Alcanivorax sp. 1008]
MSVTELHHLYRQGTLTPRSLVAQLRPRIDAHADLNVWITLLDNRELKPILDRLDGHSPDTLPLFGIPFAVKDNIDLAGVPTTAACKGLDRLPTETATIVNRLVEAGAIPIGKTNMDQFATGLVGTRSPFGTTRNAFDPALISGGSSSGSAVAVALGEVTFALGTDTAGSGRVPAAFNNIIGIKPTRGRWSCHGIVPACRTLDCPSLFVIDPLDGARISAVLDGADPLDPYSRDGQCKAFNTDQLRIGVPQSAQLKFFGSGEYEAAFQQTLNHWRELGASIIEIDYAPFVEAAALLYEGPWVTERWLAAEQTLEQRPETVLPVIAEIIGGGGARKAAEYFRAEYRLAALRAQAAELFEQIDVLLTPTAGRHFRISEVAQDPIVRNSELGYYTNFMNLLDLAAVSVPAGFTGQSLPFGITLSAPAFFDESLLALAQRWLAGRDQPMGACGHRLRDRTPLAVPGRIQVAVCGAHLSGMPLNHQLTSRDAWLVKATRSAIGYRLYALPGGPPFRPAMVRDVTGGAIEVEVWSVPEDRFGSFVAGIPSPLGIGRIELEDGSMVSGFICEQGGIQDAEDITEFGGWREYMRARQSA